MFAAVLPTLQCNLAVDLFSVIYFHYYTWW